MDGEFDYSSWRTRDLLDALRKIDRKRYPENFANLRSLLEIRGYLVLEEASGRVTPIRIATSEDADPQPIAAQVAAMSAAGVSLPNAQDPASVDFLMRANDILKALARNAQQLVPDVNWIAPRKLGMFLRSIGRAAVLAVREPEFGLFILLQWIVVLLGYVLWVQMLFWIPDEVWRAASEDQPTTGANIVLLAWSVLVVGLTTLPLGLLSGMMVSVHLLRRYGHTSTILGCLRLSIPRMGSLWGLHWVDGWMTVTQILDRLPKRRSSGRVDIDTSLASEVAYYAWKIAVAGVLPALLLGHSLARAARESFGLLRHRALSVVVVRAGYSLACWIVGIAAYAGAIALIFFTPDLGNVLATSPTAGAVGGIYLLASIPIAVAAAIVLGILRPAYLITLVDLYVDHKLERGEDCPLPYDHDAPVRWTGTAALAALVASSIVALYVFREPLGLQMLIDAF